MLDIFVLIYLDSIFIYIEDLDQPFIKAIKRVFKKLKRYYFFAKLLTCWFYKDNNYVLAYIVSTCKLQIKNEMIKIIKN